MWVQSKSFAANSVVLQRYLSRERVWSSEAFADVGATTANVMAQPDALAMLPRPSGELVGPAHELVVETFADKAEALSGWQVRMPEDLQISMPNT